jgi:hypothetical protein
MRFYKITWRLKPRLHSQNPPARVKSVFSFKSFFYSTQVEFARVAAVSTAGLYPKFLLQLIIKTGKT